MCVEFPEITHVLTADGPLPGSADVLLEERVDVLIAWKRPGLSPADEKTAIEGALRARLLT